MIYFKNLHDRLKNVIDAKTKSQIIKESAKMLNMQKRQVYKWLWDESAREKQRTKEESLLLSQKN